MIEKRQPPDVEASVGGVRWSLACERLRLSGPGSLRNVPSPSFGRSWLRLAGTRWRYGSARGGPLAWRVPRSSWARADESQVAGAAVMPAPTPNAGVQMPAFGSAAPMSSASSSAVMSGLSCLSD